MKENETEVILEDKDEYWGEWERCIPCNWSQPDGYNFCGCCGKKIIRKESSVL